VRVYTKAVSVSRTISGVSITAPSRGPCSTEGPGARRRQDVLSPPPSATSGIFPSTTSSGRANILESQLERGAAPAAEDEEIPAKRVEVEALAYPREAVYPLSEVDRFDGHQDAHLGGGDLDHRKNCPTSSVTLQAPLILILSPVGFSISMVYSVTGFADMASSINAGDLSLPAGTVG
jgi:hypothetical protein